VALLTPPRTAQSPLVAYYGFRFDDTAVDINGDIVDFGATNLGPSTIEVIPLPPGAAVISGQISTIETFDGGTKFEVSIGDELDIDRYLSLDNKKFPGYSPIVPTGFVGNGENILLTFTLDGLCTTGAAYIYIEYVVAGRAGEVQIV
jgi:hypothetical protein